MHAPSPFQTLPMLIAEAIADYYYHGLLHRSLGIKHDRANKLWSVLHDVSFSWRIIALRNLYKNANLMLSSDGTDDVLSFTSVQRKTEGRADLLGYIKDISLSIEYLPDNPDEEKFQDIARRWSDELVFPRAQSLRIGVFCNNEYEDVFSNAPANVYSRWLVERIRSSFPKLRNVMFISNEYDCLTVESEFLNSIEWNSGSFLSAFVKEAERPLSTSLPSIMSNSDLLMQTFPQFTSISLVGDYSFSSEFAQCFIKGSATTLESLDIQDRDLDFIRGCVFRDDGHYVTYHKLKTLTISTFMDSSDHSTSKRAAGATTPFPRLQRLQLSQGWVFSDYTMFNGCTNTLTHLDIGLDSESVEMLQKNKVFSRGKFSQLRNIAVFPHYHRGVGSNDYDFPAFAFGLISPATSSLRIGGTNTYATIKSIVPTFPNAAHLRSLTLELSSLSLTEMLDVIRLLPNMSTFACGFTGVDPVLCDLQDTTIPDHLYPHYHLLSHRLKTWHAHQKLMTPMGPTAIAAITLAVLCPIFNFAYVQIRGASEYNAEIERALDSGLYDKYAEKIKRLLYCSDS